jgi:hypothetical protein
LCSLSLSSSNWLAQLLLDGDTEKCLKRIIPYLCGSFLEFCYHEYQFRRTKEKIEQYVPLQLITGFDTITTSEVESKMKLDQIEKKKKDAKGMDEE